MTSSRHELEQLYLRLAPPAFRRARRLLGNEADAHEIVHDLFLSLLQRPEQFAKKSSMATFIYSSVTHACLNRIRDRATRDRLLRRDHAERPQIATPEPEARLLLQSVLRRLPEQLAQVAIYYYVDELTHAEIARVLCCSRRQVGNLIARLSDYDLERELKACR